MSCEDPDHPDNWPRNLFVWRCNLLGSSGKGHEYFLKHLLGTSNGVQGKDLGKDDAKPSEVVWHDKAPEGKLDLLVTLDFRMSTTCLYTDIVLPTATWYEKNDLNTSDMHPFIHPLSTAVDPAWQIAQRLGDLQGLRQEVQRGLRRPPGRREGSGADAADARHRRPSWPSPSRCKDWKKGECELIPGKTAPQIAVVERDYPNVYKRFTALGPLMNKVGNGGKGIGWNTQTEVEQLGELNGMVRDRRRDQGHAEDRDRHRRLRGDPAAGARDQRPCGGEGLGGAGQADRAATTRTWRCTARTRRSASATCRRSRARSSARPPGAASRARPSRYNAGYTNVHELIPWRTLTGRQQFYLDHPWMIAFGEGFSSYRPPVDLKTTAGIHNIKPQRQQGDPAQLHHAAPEVGHPQHLQRQPDDADAEPRRPGGLAERGRRQERRHRRQRLGRAVQHQRRHRGARGGQPARQPRHGDDVPRAGKDHQHARVARSPACAAASTTR